MEVLVACYCRLLFVRLTLLLFVVVAIIAVVAVVVVIAVIDDNDNHDTAAVSVFSVQTPVPSPRRSPVQNPRSAGQGQAYAGMF